MTPFVTDKIGLAAFLLTQGVGFPEIIPSRGRGWVQFQFDDPQGDAEFLSLEYECGAEDDSRAMVNAYRLQFALKKLHNASNELKKTAGNNRPT